MVSEIGGLPPYIYAQQMTAGMEISPGFMHNPDDSTKSTSTGTSGAAPEIVTDVLYIQPFIPKWTQTFNNLLLRTTTGHDNFGTLAKMGIYNFDLATGRPTTLLVEIAEQTLAAAGQPYGAAASWTLYKFGLYAVVTTFDFSSGNCVVMADTLQSNAAVANGLKVPAGLLSTDNYAAVGIQTRTYDGTLPSSHPAGTITWTINQLPPTAFMTVA